VFGELDLLIKGNDGTVYYAGSAIPTSTFAVAVDGGGRITLRVDARDHSGGFKINW
jgi:hypothetical protein